MGTGGAGRTGRGGWPDLATADLETRSEIWTDLAPKLYAQAAAAQWDPATAVDWDAAVELPDEVEAAVVQVMTYLVENEQAALMVPARFLGRIHPHIREVVAVPRRADRRRGAPHRGVHPPGAAGGRPARRLGRRRPGLACRRSSTSPTSPLASFLLSVLGEGTFLHLLAFLDRSRARSGDRARCARLALQDEARHVAFGARLTSSSSCGAEPALRERLGRRGRAPPRRARRRPPGSTPTSSTRWSSWRPATWAPTPSRRGWMRCRPLQAEMDEGRRRRLVPPRVRRPARPAELSALHTRNFM